MMAAAMARATSNPLTLLAPPAGAMGAGRAEGIGAAGGRATDAGAEPGRCAGVPATGGRGGCGAPTAGGGATPPAAVAGGGGPPGGKVGSLMVAVGLGGKLMRTVSFLGWTLEASGGFGGTPPVGRFGLLSAINFYRAFKLRLRGSAVKLLIGRGSNSFLSFRVCVQGGHWLN